MKIDPSVELDAPTHSFAQLKAGEVFEGNTWLAIKTTNNGSNAVNAVDLRSGQQLQFQPSDGVIPRPDLVLLQR